MAKQTTKAESTNDTRQSESREEEPTGTSDIPAGSTADAIALLSSDHRKVEQLFQQYGSANDINQKRQLARQICTELNVHTTLEEQLFYPACREKGVEDDLLDEAQVEHDGAKVLITELMSGSPDDEFFDAKVKVLEEYIKHHVNEEEKESDGIFAKAKQAGVDMKSLGEQLQARKPVLVAKMESSESELPKIRSFNSQRYQYQPESHMNRQSNERERNSQGQFESSGRNHGRYQSYENDSRSGSGRGWYGNPEGHSRASEEGWENRSGGSRGDSRDNHDRNDRDEYDGDRGSSNTGRGWYGDPEGHSRASEEGWENRDGGSRGDSRDNYGRGDRDEYDGDRGYSNQGNGGYGDSQGYSRTSEGWDRGSSSRENSSRNDRNDYDDSRRSSASSGEGRGWRGDPQGHARAAQEGWEHRGGSRNGHSNSTRGHSSSVSGEGRGWHGDSQGHAEAARHRGR